MPSLLDAIQAKYGDEDENIEVPVGIYVPRIGPRQLIPRLLILNDFGVDSAGDEESLEKICSGVLEIDLAHNQLTDWNEISKILHYTSSVTFVNLSFNNLGSSLSSQENSYQFPILSRLSTLILIGTKISWDSVWSILRKADALAELNLSLNEFYDVEMPQSIRDGDQSSSRQIEEENSRGIYGSLSDSGHGSSSDDDEGITFPNIKRFFFAGNPIQSWDEVIKLGICFPSLRHLCLADCPITTITEQGYEHFENLENISLSNTTLEDINQIALLNLFPVLTELRISAIPALSEVTELERREILIALLPKITRINGGAPITNQEREFAERSFIRRHLSTENPPPRYFELKEIHGELAPLIDVQLKPTTKAKVRIIHEETVLDRQISVYQTTNELKVSLEPLLGIPTGKMRLFYYNRELEGAFGPEEMRFPKKLLYSYNIQDGDEIRVDVKCSMTYLGSSPPKSSTPRTGIGNE